MRVIYIFLTLAFCYSSVLYAQSLERFVIGATGGETLSGDMHLEFTAGESVVSTVSSGSFILNNGFNQTNPPFNTDIENLRIEVGYSVYPNPTYDLVTLELDAESPVDLRIEVIDIQGKRTAIPMQNWSKIKEIKTEFNLSNLPEGIYLLRIISPTGSIAKAIRIEKRG